ncbi:MAG: creatininase family protein [Saprospiraceae bacterium]|nr:creatininase family protein [Saprospiraceae bacterium]
MVNKRPYILAESTWKVVRDTNYKVAILPWGATEAHNYHLPYATDNYESEYVASESARMAWDSGAKTIVLPCIPFGVNTGQLDLKLCMNMNPSTQYAILMDIADVLLRHEIRKLVIINSHGGNNFKNMIRELSVDFPSLFVCSVDWWKIGNASEFFDEPGDHAGELETSVMMKIQPQLLLPIEEAGPGIGKAFKIKGLKDGWVTSQRQWTKVTEDTGVGNPQKANKEKGASFLKMTTHEIAEFLIQLSETPIEELYET